MKLSTPFTLLSRYFSHSYFHFHFHFHFRFRFVFVFVSFRFVSFRLLLFHFPAHPPLSFLFVYFFFRSLPTPQKKKENAKMEAELSDRQIKLDFYNQAKTKMEALYHQEVQMREAQRKKKLQDLIANLTEEAKSPAFQQKYFKQCISSLGALGA